jgi:hypothetical protein
MRGVVVRAALAALLVGGSAGPAIVAQSSAPPPGQPYGRWVVADDPFADLWFHCLALIGYEGYGPLPLYDHSYAGRMREANRRADSVTSLDRRSAELRRRLERDSILEVVHFLPLYFVGRNPDAVLAALHDAVRMAPDRSRQREPVSSIVSATAEAVAATISSNDAQATFRELLDVVDDEWRQVLRIRTASQSGERRQLVEHWQRTWDRDFAPAVAALGNAIPRVGTIIVSDALGPEGRVVLSGAGSPVVAVGRSARSRDPGAPLFAVIRELSFGLVRGAGVAYRVASDRAANEYVGDVAATRAGAMLLDAAAPALGDRYRSVFQANAAPRIAPFEVIYPLDSGDELRLRRAIAATTSAGARRR